MLSTRKTRCLPKEYVRQEAVLVRAGMVSNDESSQAGHASRNGGTDIG